MPTGRLVLPGGVDSHAHIEQLSANGLMNADTWESAFAAGDADIGAKDVGGGGDGAAADHGVEGGVGHGSGRLVLPGGVDSHAHIEQLSANGLMNADTWESATRSAMMRWKA
jgi:dihydroorotase-like cyclic amidohydrolase